MCPSHDSIMLLISLLRFATAIVKFLQPHVTNKLSTRKRKNRKDNT